MIRYVTIYFSQASAIVASNHATPDGIIYEQDNPEVLTRVVASLVGDAFKRALAAFCVRKQDLRFDKKSDWPAFRASRCSSMKRFEKEFKRLTIADTIQGGIFMRASTPARRNPELEISRLLDPRDPDETLGRKLLEVVRYETEAEPGATDNPGDAQ